MAIDEELIRLQDVPTIVRELRPGSKAFHWTTVYRWCTRGCRGVKLWSEPVGWGRMTNRRAVREFLDAIANRHSQPASTPASERQVKRALKAREKQLAAAGW